MSKPTCPMCEMDDLLEHSDHYECMTCGHEWEAEARRELLLAASAHCEGLDGVVALNKHERAFECGSLGPARATTVGRGSGTSSGRGYPGQMGF